MKTILNRYYRYLITYFTNLWLYSKRFYIKKDKANETKKIICIDIKSNVYRRHLANMIFWFHEQGYTIYLKHRFTAIGSMKYHLKKVFQLPNFKIKNRISVSCGLVFTGDKNNLSNNEIYLNPEYFEDENYYHIPLGMHPDMYFRNYYRQALGLKNNEKRSISVFFSGNMNMEAYNREVISKKFKKLTRKEIADTLLNKLPKNQIVFPSKKTELENDNSSKVVFNDKNKIPITQNNFLQFLSNCNFFLCTPGVIHPICHNNFEAMSVGTILILQYPEYFYPNLEHGKNCLVFNDEKDLIEKMNYALEMTNVEIRKMRNNVIRYYNEYVAPKSIVKKIIQSHKNGERIIYIGLD